MPLQRPHHVTLLVGLVLLAGCTGSITPPSPPAAGSIETGRWTPAGRRQASRAPAPGESLAVPVPHGAREVVTWVLPLVHSAWPFRGSVSASVRAVDARGVPLAETVRTIPLASPEDATWSRIALILPASSEALELTVDGGHHDEAWWARPSFAGVAPAAARNVVLVSLDTVRADAVSHLGQALSTTPRLDALAARGTTFRHALAAAPWTLPSHVSVLTGTHASRHGRWTLETRGGPAVTPLPERLARAGWETAAFTGQGSISWVFGATAGFDLVVEHPPTREDSDARECDLGVAAAVRWLEERPRRLDRAPFLLFWHTYEPHWPYTDERFVRSGAPLPAGVPEAARPAWERYLGDVAAADAALGALLDALEGLGLDDSTDVIVFSDHGEEFGEHSGGCLERRCRHGHGLWDTLLRVPLVVRARGMAPGVRDHQVSLIDVHPTILRAAGLSPEPGRARALQLEGGDALVAAEALFPEFAVHQQRAIRRGDGWKLVWTASQPPRAALHDTSSDPGETRDLSHSHPATAAELSAHLDEYFAGAVLPQARQDAREEGLTDAEREALRALGYVH